MIREKRKIINLTIKKNLIPDYYYYYYFSRNNDTNKYKSKTI